MTSWECYENKWFYMKYIGKYFSGEILLTRECSWRLCHSGGLLTTRHRLKAKNVNNMYN